MSGNAIPLAYQTPDIIGNMGRLATAQSTAAGIPLIGAQTAETLARVPFIGAQTQTEQQRPALIGAQTQQATAAARELLARANLVDPASAAELRAQASSLLASAGKTTAETYPILTGARQTQATEDIAAPSLGYRPAGPRPPGMAPLEGPMGAAEGGGNSAAVNAGGYSGNFQFGAERLADPSLGLYTPAPGEDLSKNQWQGTFHIPGYPNVQTHQDFLNSPAAQHTAYALHVANIDEQIAATPGADQFDQNGLRAVAHLGGVSGMQRFVETNGGYNPADANGTRLSDYYTRFAQGGAPALQAAFGSPYGRTGPPALGGSAQSPAPGPGIGAAPTNPPGEPVRAATAPPAVAGSAPVSLPGMPGPTPALTAVQPGGWTGTPEQRQAFQTQRANSMMTVFNSAGGDVAGIQALSRAGYITPVQRDGLLANPANARNFITQQLPIAAQPTPGVKAQIERDTPIMTADLQKNEANVETGLRAATDQYNLKNIKTLVDGAPNDLLGAGAQVRLAIQKYAEEFMPKSAADNLISAITKIPPGDVARLQDLQKAFLSNVLSNERTQGVQRIGAMSTQYFAKASPAIDMTKPAVQQIVNLGLVAQQMSRDFADSSNNFYSNSRDATNDSLTTGPYQRYAPLTGLEKQWLSADSSHGPDVYAAAANLMNGMPQTQAFRDFNSSTPAGRAKMVEAIKIIHRTDPDAVRDLGYAAAPQGQ